MHFEALPTKRLPAQFTANNEFKLLDLILSNDIIDAEDEGGKGSLVQKIKTAALNERSAPELLEYKEELVDQIKQSLRSQKQRINGPFTEFQFEEKLFTSFQQMEIDRISYLLRSYLRSRIVKIEKHHSKFVSDETYHQRLSPSEQKFAQSYTDLIKSHYRESFLQSLPDRVNSGEEDAMTARINLDEYVICRVLERIGQIELDDQTDEFAELNENDVVLIRYRPIQHLLVEGKVELL
ncbi:hypothetical protein PROFUN_05473 [Planoprotostelium fungivorum]|uniref:DNA replication complex GINS protein SLD5 n=1 Tax=Planoprotostelium fungivorum TaxID=1890364 RepID=A0A2P6NQT8_9EUKA|nr:hypothetical protein PROFUN_05473 [Planoprotostelium fungivorum]